MDSAHAAKLSSRAGAAAAVLAFVGITAWWLTQDSRVPNGDAGRHLVYTWNYLQAIEQGQFRVLLEGLIIIDAEFYPPFTHLVGVLGAAIGGYGVVPVVLADNLVFVPLLALGVYGATSTTYDSRAGALAVVFALGMPILISQFHVFMLDAPLTAMAAVSVWLLLLTNRFERVGISALAGLAVALGTMTKITFPVFVAGMVVVMLARGGWRNWRGAVVFAGVLVLVTQPWILFHWDPLLDRTDRATAGPTNPRYADDPLGNYGSYFWNVLDNQLLFPLFAFFAVGTVVSAISWLRARRPDQFPELLAGLVVGFVAAASLSYVNERYTMPCLVFMAILGTGWIAWLSPVKRWIAAATLVLFVLANTVMVNTGSGGLVAIDLPLTSHNLTLFSDRGYVEAEPVEGEMPGLLEAAASDGIERVAFHGESLNSGGYNLNGLAALAWSEDLDVLPQWEAQNLGPNGLFGFRAVVADVKRRPCFPTEQGYGIYFTRGGPPGPGIRLYCPP